MFFKIILLGIVAVALVGTYWLVSSVFFLETAQYEVSMKEGDFEVRDYAELVVVTASMQSTEGNSAFRKLFQFIQGKQIQVVGGLIQDQEIGVFYQYSEQMQASQLSPA